MDATTIDWIEAAKALQPPATIVIACAAVFNLWTIRNFQKQNHRPIISAFIRIKKSTNTHNAIELVIKNSGNCPATEIKIVANKHQIYRCIHKSFEDENQYLENILYILSEKFLNPLLIDGEEDGVDFFYSTDSWDVNEKCIWKRRSSLSISIFYKDLNRNKYRASQTLLID